LRVMFATEKPLEGEFSLIAPNGKVAAKSQERHGGPPYFWFAELDSPAVGTWQAQLTRADAPAECRIITHKISVRQVRPPRLAQSRGSVWPLRSTWDRATEDLYSAWIEKLFDAPLDAELSWPALHEVLRDPSRNLLFNHLGLSEDQKGLIVRPDCADLPYFLRAYFAFKMGLSFGYSKCSRGGGEPPKCYEWWNIQNEESPPAPPEQKVASSGGSLFGMFGEPTVRLAPRLPPRPQGLASWTPFSSEPEPLSQASRTNRACCADRYLFHRAISSMFTIVEKMPRFESASGRKPKARLSAVTI